MKKLVLMTLLATGFLFVATVQETQARYRCHRGVYSSRRYSPSYSWRPHSYSYRNRYSGYGNSYYGNYRGRSYNYYGGYNYGRYNSVPYGVGYAPFMYDPGYGYNNFYGW